MNITRMNSYCEVTIKKVPNASGDSTKIYKLSDLTDVPNLLKRKPVRDMYGDTVSIPFENFIVDDIREVILYGIMSGDDDGIRYNEMNFFII